MKTFFTLVVALTATTLIAQEPIVVRDGSVTFKGGSYPAYTVTIHGTTGIFVEREWKALIKDASEKVTTKKEWFIDNARISSISQDTIDIYSKVVDLKKTGNVDFTVAFNVGGTFVGIDDEKRHAAAKKYVYDFAFRTTKLVVNEEILAAQKVVEKSNSEQAELEKENERLNNTIEKNNTKIEKAEKELEQNAKALEKMTSDIEVKRSLVGSSSNEKDAKDLQKLLSKRSALERNTDKLNGTIRTSKKKIEDAEYGLTKNAENQEKKKLEIEENTKKLDSARAKLMNVK